MKDKKHLILDGSDKTSLVDRVKRENFWNADLKRKHELLERAIEELNVYYRFQGVSSLMLTTFTVDDTVEPPRLGRIEGNVLPFECYVLDKVFRGFMDKASIELLFRKAGERSPEEPPFPKGDTNHLYTSPAFVKEGTKDYSRFRRYNFFRHSFTHEETKSLKDRVETAFMNFAASVDPNYMGITYPYPLYAEKLLEIRMKISPVPFGDYQLKEGTVVGYQKHEYFGFTFTQIRLPDGETELIDPIGVEHLRVGQEVKYLKRLVCYDISDSWQNIVIGVKNSKDEKL